MYSFRRTDGWYDGRPVAAGSTPSKLISARSSASTNASIMRTGLLSSMKSSRHSGNSVHCPRSASSTKRLIDSSRKNHARIITAPRRFHTARVKSRHAGRDHGTSATDLTADVLGCQFVNSCCRFYASQLAHLLEFWLNSTEWSDERHSGGGF